jgi:hypothetical protein
VNVLVRVIASSAMESSARIVTIENDGADSAHYGPRHEFSTRSRICVLGCLVEGLSYQNF